MWTEGVFVALPERNLQPVKETDEPVLLSLPFSDLGFSDGNQLLELKDLHSS